MDLQQLKQKALELQREIDRLVKKEKVILVPDEIEFEIVGNNRLGLKFDGDRSLYFLNIRWCVDDFKKSNKIQCKLVPCSQDDLEAGDWYYMTDDENDDFTEKYNYCLFLGKNNKCIVNDQDVFTDDEIGDYCYRVEMV